MRQLIRLINNFFIKTILVIFYFLIIGAAALIYRLFRKKSQKESYWEEISPKILDIDYFKSAY